MPESPDPQGDWCPSCRSEGPLHARSCTLYGDKPTPEPWPNAGDRACEAANKAEPLVNAFVPAPPAPSQRVYSEEEARKRGGGMIRCFAENYSCDWEASKGSKYCHHHEYLEQSAPSQPAREWAEQIVADVFPSMDSQCAVRYVEQVTQRLIAFSAQQSAAKEAEIADLNKRLEAVVWACDEREKMQRAAERERDSLRDALTQRQRLIHNAQQHQWSMFEKCDHLECREVRELAALKAGKE